MDEQVEKEKRKVHRSPSYPVFDLEDAITKVDAVYKSEKRSPTTSEVIASHMGYSQANGPGGRAISALRQFGLIEENAGKHRISDLGYTLIQYARDSGEWQAAAMEAIRKPSLFRELLDEYSEGLPSDATLRNDLLKRNFNPGSIGDVISIFRATMALAGSSPSVHNEEVSTTAPFAKIESSSGPVLQKPPSERKDIALAQISTPVGTTDGQVVFAHVRFDSDIKKEFVTSLKKYLDYLESTLN